MASGPYGRLQERRPSVVVQQNKTLGIHIAQSRLYVYTLGPKVVHTWRPRKIPVQNAATEIASDGHDCN